MPDIKAEVAGKIVTPLGYDGANFQNIAVDAADGHLQVDVLTSGLPAGAATAANQATILTRLAQIRDLEDSGNVYYYSHTTIAMGTYFLVGHSVAGSRVFVLTAMSGRDISAAITNIYLGVHVPAGYRWFDVLAAPAANTFLVWGGRVYIPAGGYPVLAFEGVNIGEDLDMSYSGYTLEV